MPIEQNRAEYLQALLQQRKQLNANNNNMLNPSVSNDIEQQALMTTNMNNKTSVNDIPNPADAAGTQDNWFMGLVKKVTGFIDEVQHAIYSGVFSAVEGIGDLFASGIGALGEATGWYDSKPFSEFVEYNWGEQAADWMMGVQQNIMGARGIYNAVNNSVEYGADYWNAVGSGSAYKDNRFNTFYGGKANRQIETPAGEFVVGMANSVGMMLPSIAVGGALGAGTALGKFAGTATLALGAAGKGSEEALQEGATISQALGYGALSGAIEGLSEYIIPESKFAGVLGKGVSKSVAKTFIKSFVEEGLEEVFSATLEPLAKYLTYDKSAIEKYTSGDYWFGADGHFNESVLGQFASGAVLGGIMGGANVKHMQNTISNYGIEVLDKVQEMIDTDKKITETKSESKLAELKELSAKQSEEYMLAYKEFMDNATESQKKNLAEMLSSPKALQNIISKEANPNEAVNSYLKKYFNSTSDILKRSFKQEIEARYGTGYEIDYGEVPNNENAYVDLDNKKIVINDKIVKEKGGALLAHEYFGHVLGQNLSAGTRQSFYNSIKETDWYKKIEDKLVKAYQVNDETYQKLDSQAKKNAYFQDEVIAKYLEEVFGNKDTVDSIRHLKKVFSQPTLLDKILNVFNKSDKFNTPNIAKEYAKVINKTIDSLYKVNKSNSLLKALIKDRNNYKLTEAEERLKSEYNNLFELMKEESKQKTQVAYSKNLITEDSNGNDLTKEQQEWNKDNKFVDEENRLLNLYHGSESAGFMEFNENYPIFLTPEFDNAYAYGGNYNIVNTTSYNSADELINDFYDNYNENTDYYQDIVKISDDEYAQKEVKEKIKEYEKQKSKFDDKRTKEFIENRIKWLENALNEGYFATTEDVEDNTIYGTEEELLREFQIDNQYNKNFDNYDYENDEAVDSETGNRIYSLYAKSTNPLIIECRGNNFLNIRYKGEILSTDEIANRVKQEGKYDGIIFKNIMDNGALDNLNSLGVSDVYVVFNPNQVKAVDNYKPTDSNDIRFSKNLDSLGNEIAPKMAERLKNSKARDENGNILVAYHGTANEGFTEFNPKENKSQFGKYKFGNANVNYFSTSKRSATSFTKLKIERNNNVYSVYLNIENPYILDFTNSEKIKSSFQLQDNKLRKQQIKIFNNLLKYYDENISHSVDNYELNRINKELNKLNYELRPSSEITDNANYSTEEGLYDLYYLGNNSMFGNERIVEYAYEISELFDKDMRNELKERIIGENENDYYFSTDDVVRLVLSLNEEGADYDGIIIKNIVDSAEMGDLPATDLITLKSANQIKAIDNENPTDSNDIRYSKNLNNQEQKQNFKNIQNTREMLDGLNEGFRKRGYNISYPIGYRNFVSKAFTEINSRVKLENQTNKLFGLIQEANIEKYNNDTKTYDKLGKFKEFFNTEELNKLKNVLSAMIESTPNTEARSKVTVSFEKTIDRLTDKAKEYKSKADRVRVFTNHKNRIKNRITIFTEATEDEIARNGLNTLLEPFMNIKGISSRGLKEALNKTLEWYNEEYLNEKFETLPYNNEIRQNLENLYLSLGEPQPMFDKDGKPLLSKKGKQKTRIDSLSTEQINTIIDIFNLVEKDIKKQTRATIENKAYAKATLKSMENLTQKKGLGKLIKKWKKGFAPSYVLLREFLGNSPLADLITTDMQQATNSNILYKGKYNDDLKKKMKELRIKDRQLAKTIKVSGLNMTVEQALYLYISLNTETNFKEINANGFQYLVDNKRLSEIYGVGKAQEIKDTLEQVLDDNYKKLGDYLKEKINTEIKQDYIKWYESRYGKFAGRNEVGKVGDKKYWMLNRSYQYAKNAEKVIKTPVAVFKNSISREKNVKNAILVGSAVSSYTTYINELGKEIFLKPIYRQAYQILNTKVDGKSVYERLQSIDTEDYKYIEKTLSDTIGGLETESDLLTNMMSGFSVAKLSLNIGSMMKQFASIYTSNIPIRKSIKASITKLFNPKARAEFRTLVDEIGGLKYREGMSVVQANVGNVKGMVAKIADVGMYGIKKMDYLTVGLGVYSLMVIGQDQFGLKIGTQENIDFVKKHWTEFELSQIGNTALSKSGISRGDYKTLARAVFGFMQGANRAAFGSQINKIGLWKRNHNLDNTVIKNEIKELNTKIDDFKNNNLNAEGNFVELDLAEDLREEYIDLQADLMEKESLLKDYEEYEIAGGKGIPVHMAAGLIAQGIFVSIITELMKHIKGKKDWDEWDILEFGTDTLYAIGLDWVPFVNTISNMIKGHEVTIPAIEIMNQAVDIINNAKSGNWQTMLRELALLLGDTTGLPFQTIYQYMYGTVKAFNPEMAYEMNSLFYGSSSQSALKSFKTYVDKGNTAKATSMMNVLMNDYKVESNEKVNKELTRLYMNGYANVLPKNYMTEYTNEKGESIELTASQIKQFRNYYNQSTTSVEALMNITDYKNMTDENQAKIIKKIYEAYYSYAKAKTLNIKADSKLGNYLLFTNGNANIGQISMVLGAVSSITDSKTKSRKELVFDYINRLKGFSKGEKLLLLYLSGYTSSANDSILKSYLRGAGMTNSQIKEFLG